MSRCFPYPPPYFDKSLIESIKKEKARQEKKKEKKMMKKEKKGKKDNREKACQVPENAKNKEQIDRKRKYQEMSPLESKDGYLTKTINDATEQLERSGLTEEHELPCSIQNTYESSESSQDSNKKRKIATPNANNNSNGNILRIKLPVSGQKGLMPNSLPVVRQKETAPKTLPAVRQTDSLLKPLPAVGQRDPASKLLPALGQTAAKSLPVVRQKYPGQLDKLPVRHDPAPKPLQSIGQKGLAPKSWSAVENDLELESLPNARQKHLEQLDMPIILKRKGEGASNELPCSLGWATEPGISHEIDKTLQRSFGSEKRGKDTLEMEQFKELILNWKAPSLQLDCADFSDQDWLSSAPRQCVSAFNKCEVNAESLSNQGCCTTASLQPRACYMPELDIYQMPYVIPY